MRETALHGEKWRTCFALLPKVSRTFALSIALLKPPMRHAVCLAYLLCRLIDTFEDAETLETSEKAAYIRALRTFVAGSALPSPDWAPRAAHALGKGVSAADRELLESLDAVLAALDSVPLRDRQVIDRCFQEMAVGMVEMQQVLDREAQGLRVLPSLESLGRYCHYVAGVVGKLLTELFFLNFDALAKDRYFDLLARSEAFGQYLQKINILKDIPGDHRKGWCFIPHASIRDAGIEPRDLLAASPEGRVQAIAPVMREVLEHLAAAWQYLSLVPPEEREYRLFLGYSFFFGVKTLALGLKEPDRSFSAERPLKIGRLDVAAVIAKVNAAIDDPEALAAYLRLLLEEARRGLDPRWPAPIAAALAQLSDSLEPASVSP